MTRFADAHCHPTDMTSHYPDYDDAGLVFACSSVPEDWDALARIPDGRMTRFYGVHPWRASEWDANADRLRSFLGSDPKAGVGEIGMDSSRDVPGQREAFVSQLDIAREYGRPVQIHDVGCEKEILDILRGLRLDVPIIMHAFSSESYSKPFCELGCYLSVNPRILKRSDARIARLMDSIPKDRLLLESDHPFSPEVFSGMRGFAERLSEACGVPADELLEASCDNAERIVG